MSGLWLTYVPIAAAISGFVWSAGCIVSGAILLRGTTGYDSWDMLWYQGISTLGLIFFALGVVVAITLLVLRRQSGAQIPTTPLWAGIALNVLFAVVLMLVLKNA